jgi:hypothetical protein
LAQQTWQHAAQARQEAAIAGRRATIACLMRSMPGSTRLTRAITVAILAQRGLLGTAASRGRELRITPKLKRPDSSGITKSDAAGELTTFTFVRRRRPHHIRGSRQR